MQVAKRYFVQRAFTEIGIANYNFDLQPDELQMALNTLDEMMAEWAGVGIDIGGWLFPASVTDSNLNDLMFVPDTNMTAIWSNLSLRLAAPKGKTVQAATIKMAGESYDALVLKRIKIPSSQYPSIMPFGQGNRRSVQDVSFYRPQPVLTGNGQQFDVPLFCDSSDLV